MRLRTFRGSKTWHGKRVLVRIDANVPVSRGRAVDGPQGKIARSAVDLEWFLQRGARLIVMSHLGRPEGKHVAAYSLSPVARRLSELLKVKVKLARDVAGPSASRLVSTMEPGEVVLLENVRFDPREEKNDASLARELASLADVYVNDAFAVSHRAHASVEAITKELPSYAGPLLAHEIQVLGSVTKSPRHPFVLLLGGLKMTTKLPVLIKLMPLIDRVLIGGALATAFFVAQGRPVGKSVFEKDGVPFAKALLKKYGKKIVLPCDVTVAARLSSQACERHVSLDKVGARDIIVDVGPQTAKLFAAEIGKAKTVVWNGPLGYCEIPKFCRGTHEVVRVMSARTGKAATVAGGGDTIPLIESSQVPDRFTLVSTGGGAMLEFLAGKKLPGVEALHIK